MREDPVAYTALYAFQHNVVTSPSLDLQVTYLAPAASIAAFQTKAYDVAESNTVTVAGAAAGGFKTLIWSAGLESAKGGSFIFVLKDSPIQTPNDLKGKTVAIGSLGGVASYQYVLQQKYGMNASVEGGDFRWIEADPNTVGNMAKAKQVDAFVNLALPAWLLINDPDFRVLIDVTSADEYQKLTGVPFLQTVMLTYPEVASAKGPAIKELNRVLGESVAYTRANLDKVTTEVGGERNVPPDYLKWAWSIYDYPLGTFADKYKQEVVSAWGMATTLGTLKEAPKLDDYTLAVS